MKGKKNHKRKPVKALKVKTGTRAGEVIPVLLDRAFSPVIYGR